MMKNTITKDQVQLIQNWHGGHLNTQLNVLINQYQSELIDLECARLNMTRNAFVRNCLLNYWLNKDPKARD